MKFTTHAGSFLQALNVANRPAARGKSTIRILDAIHITLEGDTLRMSGSDLDSTATVTTTVTGDRDGEVCVIPSRIINTLKTVDSSTEVELVVDPFDLEVTLHIGQGQYQVMGLSPDDFPDVPDITDAMDLVCSADGAALVKAIRKYEQIVPKTNPRPEICGLRVSVKGNVATFTGTNGHMLLRERLEVSGNRSWEGTLSRWFMFLVNILKDEEELSVYATDSHFFLAGEKMFATTKLRDDEYPEVEKVFPASDEKATLTMCAAELEDAVARSMPYAQEKPVVTADALTAVLTGQNPYRGSEMREVLLGPVRWQGEPREVSVKFNGNYMKEILGAFGSEDIEVELHSETKPLVMNGESGSTALLMPVFDTKTKKDRPTRKRRHADPA